MKKFLLFLFVSLILSGFNAKAQTALEFDGVDDYVQTDFPGVLEDQSRTFMAWIYLSEAPTSDMCILDYGIDDDGARNTFMVNEDGYLQFDMGGEILTGTFGGTLPTDEWVHVAFVFTGDEGLLYVNGDLSDNGNIFDLFTPEDEETLRIGQSISGESMPFNGMIDEVSVWSIDVEEEDITSYSCIDGTDIPSGVVAYYDFNDGSGFTLTELVDGWDGDLENMDEEDWVTSTVCGTPYNVSFVVTKDNGVTPIKNAEVVLDGLVKYTDASGEATFEAFPGTYNYTVSKAGYFDASSTVEVVDADVTVDVSLILTGENYDITFTVTDGTNPLENALVDLGGVQQNTDATGETVFIGYLPDTYSYTVTKDEYYEQTSSVEVIDINVTENVALAPIVYYDITFIVTDESATNPIENALVNLDGVEQYTNAAGETTFIDILPEIYPFSISKDSYYSESGDIEVVDDDVTVEVSMLAPVLTALEFDGGNDYVQTTCPGVYGSLPRTVMAWIYLTSNTGANKCISDYGRNASAGRNTFIVSGSEKLGYLSGTSTGNMTSPNDGDIPIGEWVHVAFVYDGTTGYLYKNGEELTSKTLPGINTANLNVGFRIGERVPGGSINFPGMIDEVSLWEVPLTQQEIQEYSCINDPDFYDGLMAYYSFNEGTGTILHDLVSGYNGILTNMDEEDWVASDVCLETKFYPQGWASISSNVIPVDKVLLEDLFDPILEDMVILVGEDGVFWPGYNINTIGHWDTYQGYKVKFANAVNFEFEGDELIDRTVTIEPGTHLFPVLSTEPVSIQDVIEPHGNTIMYVFDLIDQKIYWPTGGIVPGVEGALETLIPGFTLSMLTPR